MATAQFWSQKLFEKSDKVRISYEGIARKCQVTTRSAKNYIKRDIQSGLIVRKRNTYHHPIFNRNCDGRNTYILTDRGRGVIRKPNPPNSGSDRKEKPTHFDFLQNLKALSPEKFLNEYSQDLPHGWLEDLPMLKKTLLLLKKKIQKGYKVQNPIGWIAAALRDQGSGYRLKVAQDVSLHLNHPTLIENCSEPVFQFYSRLQYLQQKGLDTSILSLLKLLRKGFSHLAAALHAMIKLLKYSLKVSNLTAFLNYLVSLKDPYSSYKKKNSSINNSVELAQDFFRANASSIKFVNRKSLPETPEKDKTYLEFLIHKTCPTYSFVRVFQLVCSSWKEIIFKATDPLFTKKIQTLVCNH